MHNTVYLTFLSSTEKVWDGISPNGRKILEVVIKQRSTNPLRVQDIIGMRSIASQATLHKCLSELITSGYISLKSDPLDGRVKFVTLSKKGISLMERLGTLLFKALSKAN